MSAKATPNRWAAFTDDELELLDDMFVQDQVEWGLSAPEVTLSDQIRGELARRKTPTKEATDG